MAKIADQLAELNIPSIESTAMQSADKHMVYAKLFALASAATWLVIGYDPEDAMLFVYADLFGEGRQGGAEWGYASLAEIEELKWAGIPRVELDIHFTPLPVPKCIGAGGKILV